MRIWLDDVREAPDGWELFEHASDVMEVLMSNPGCVTHISLDNDLGELVEGWHVAKLIAALAHSGMLLRIKLYAHTANPIAAKQMQSYFRMARVAWGD